ncbi:hypothetical protein MMC21_003329 [Puttea exsequens]|nr:hypothetical protein [Puttea exsequens]
MTKRYPGVDRYFFVPGGIVASIAPYPEPLCARCRLLDFPGFFLDVVDDSSYSANEVQVLDTVDNVLQKSSSCGFCVLVIAALHARSLGTVSKDGSSRATVNGEGSTIYLRGAHAGQYHIDESGGHNVGCISVYTDLVSTKVHPNDTRSNQGLIRLIANDAHLLGQQPLYHGRMIGNHLSPQLLWSWIKTCKDYHKRCAQARFQWDFERLTGPRSLTLIDPVKMCLIRHRPIFFNDYVALSYVWGGQQGLQLNKANRSELFKRGALSRAWAQIPAFIQDAIDLVRDLDPLYHQEPYDPEKPGTPAEKHLFIWVDQLCIVQDDHADKAVQIEQMGHIYSTAVATFMAIAGDHSNVKLNRLHPGEVAPGLFPNDEDFTLQRAVPDTQNDPLQDIPPDKPASQTRSYIAEQVIKNIGGLRLVAALPNIDQALDNCKWATRAWTLQETELSHCAILFGKHQVYFRCQEVILQEDLVAEKSSDAIKEAKPPDINWKNPRELERTQRPSNDNQWPQTWEMYAEIVENYTARNMTFPTDILAAFRGVAQVMHTLTAWDMPNCLPTDVLDYALLWRPRGEIRRRFSQNKICLGAGDQKELQLPTYAWAAWTGNITYQPCSFTLRSLIQRFERMVGDKLVHVPRFSQDGSSRKTLEPEDQWAPEDATMAQSFGRTTKWAGPQARSLAFRMHIVNKSSSMSNGDGPIILQFRARSLKVRISNARVPVGPTGATRVLLLDYSSKKVGFAWHVPWLDEIDLRGQGVDVILLSKYKTGFDAAKEWVQVTGEGEVAQMNEWCLLNVMLVLRVPGRDLVERITIGKIHEEYVGNAKEELINLA